MSAHVANSIQPLSGQTFAAAVPQQERLTVQREANDLHGAIQKAHDLLDLLTSAPTPQTGQANAALLPVSVAVSGARTEAVRLCERLDSLVQAFGQI